MTEPDAPTAASWRAGAIRDFSRSDLFDRTFQEGMTLVEETAAYLDGAGRQDSKLLSRNAAMIYAGESMRLTTRLMQVASWLLVQRAVKEGDLSAQTACEDRYRLAEEPPPSAEDAEAANELPPAFRMLSDRTVRLYERVRHLDMRMYRLAPEIAPLHPVQMQFARLQAAFGG